MKTKRAAFAVACLGVATGFASEATDLFVKRAREKYADPAYTNTCVLCFKTDKSQKNDKPNEGGGGVISWIDVEGARNVRDLGGWNGLRTGRVFRGSELNPVKNHGLGITEKGRKTLVEDLRIKTDLDFRGVTPKERADCVTNSAMGTGVKLVDFPIGGYMSIFSNKTFPNAVRFFANDSAYPIYMHCWGGADRTGSLAFVLEGLCGVNEVDLQIDYELTSFATFGLRTRVAQSPYKFAEMFATMKAYPGAALKDKFEYYALNVLKLSPDEIAAIRRNLCKSKEVATVTP